MRICAISDIHGQLPKIPECDCLLIAGDICPPKKVWTQLTWLKYEFRWWLRDLGVPVFACAGNHDWPFYEYPEDIPDLPWTYLEDSSAEFNGLKIYGTPWQRTFFDWAFNLDECLLAGKWNGIPDDTDILISHSPPQYYGDLTKSNEHVGSTSLLMRIEYVKPKLAVFGHIHPGRGEWNHRGTKLANVAMTGDNRYKLIHEPWVYDLEVEDD